MSLRLLLPARRRLAMSGADPDCLRALARADRLDDAVPGYSAQAYRQFDLDCTSWPEAAFSRVHDVGDAQDGVWLRADPAHVRAEIAGVRLLACAGLGVSNTEAAAFADALRPCCAAHDLQFSAPANERWYVRLPEGSALPQLPPLELALGADLDESLPSGADGRRWRAWLNETQIVLHNHPCNAQRVAAHRPIVNSVWPHGGGALPGRVGCAFASVQSHDPALLGAAALAGSKGRARDAAWDVARAQGTQLLDLRDVPVADLAPRWLLPIWADIRRGRLRVCELDFADGARRRWHARSRLYFWRRADRALA